jgi:lipopolysaccharide assembly protein A
MLFNLLSSLILALWIVLISVMSIQNVADVTLHFLSFESIKIPVGVVMALSLSVGIIVQPLLISILSKK